MTACPTVFIQWFLLNKRGPSCPSGECMICLSPPLRNQLTTTTANTVFWRKNVSVSRSDFTQAGQWRISHLYLPTPTPEGEDLSLCFDWGEYLDDQDHLSFSFSSRDLALSTCGNHQQYSPKYLQLFSSWFFIGLYPLTLCAWAHYADTLIDKSEQEWNTLILNWASKMLLIQNAPLNHKNLWVHTWVPTSMMNAIRRKPLLY